MNPVYSPVQPGAPYGNPKTMAYTGKVAYAVARINNVRESGPSHGGYAVSRPRILKYLSLEVRIAASLMRFNKLAKTKLFKRAFN